MFPLGLVLLSVLFVTCNAQVNRKVPYLLPNTTVPSHYTLDLLLDLDQPTKYEGFVDIRITVLESTDTIVLHSNNLDVIYNRSFVSDPTNTIKISDGNWNRANHFLTLTLERKIEPGNYGLELFFWGYYNPLSFVGLFLNIYHDAKGNERYLIGSHLEPNHARNIFPCYDEPNLKATFKLRVRHQKEYHVVSNTPVASVAYDKHFQTTIFKKTAKMSTYLLALVMSEFKTLERTYNGKPVRLYVKADEVANTKFSLDISVKALHQFEKLLGVDYSLPKLDGVSIPTFGGGMENWGLIIYGKSVIVKNPAANNRGVVNLLVHEIAHQWFGNLVTLDWWDYVWLNEGFATYYAQRVADLIEPENRYMYNHYVSKILPIKRVEDRPTFKDSLNRHVELPAELRTKFNSVSYDKGSVIVRFMSIIFGNFDYSISRYLKKYSFGNTIPSNLFKTINDGALLPSGANVQKIMNNWVTNPGYPLITLNITRDKMTRIEIKQERFTLDGSYLPEKWWIPVILATQESMDFERSETDIWLRDQDESIITDVEGIQGWVIANARQAVYCRVNYDHENWKKIIEYLKGPDFEKIHVLNRIQLIDDSNNLAKSQRLPEKIVLDLLSYLKHEKDELVLKSAGSAFISYAHLLKDTPAFGKYKKFVVDILGPNSIGAFKYNPQELDDFLADPMFETEKGYRNSAFIQKLTEHIYSMDDVHQVHKQLFGWAKVGKVPFGAFEQLWEDIMDVYRVNLDVKERFFQYNYPVVEAWLDSNY